LPRDARVAEFDPGPFDVGVGVENLAAEEVAAAVERTRGRAFDPMGAGNAGRDRRGECERKKWPSAASSARRGAKPWPVPGLGHCRAHVLEELETCRPRT